MIVIFVVFIDQLIDYPINRASFRPYISQKPKKSKATNSLFHTKEIKGLDRIHWHNNKTMNRKKKHEKKPHSSNRKASQRTKDTRTIALELSVVKLTGE